MTALVSPCVEEKGTLSIILFFNGDENNYSVNELLVRLQLASSDVFNFNYDMANNNENDNGKLIVMHIRLFFFVFFLFLILL